MKRVSSSAIAVCGLVCLGFGQGAKHPFGIDDLANIPVAFPVAVSPGGIVLYQIWHGAESGPTVTEWRSINCDGSSDQKLDLPKGFRPLGFNRDGDLYGRYSASSKSEIGIFAFAGLSPSAHPKRELSLPFSGYGSLSISPEGNRFAILADPRPDNPDSKFKTVVEPPQTGLYVIDADGSHGRWQAPNLQNISQVAWSQDEKSLAVSSSLPKIGHHYVKSQIDIVDDSGSRQVAEIDGAISGLAWSEGGRSIAFLATTTSVITPDHVWTVPAAGGKPLDRTPDLNGSAMSLSGDCFGRVWVQVNRGVKPECDLFENGRLTRVKDLFEAPTVPDVNVGHPPLVIEVGGPDHMANIAVVLETGPKKITSVGDAEFSKIDLGPLKVIHWTSREGIRLEGIATFPAGFVEGRRYPFLVMPHGGPESNDIVGIDSWARVFAGQGYVVIQPQYRGSTGYGSEFLNAIYQHFGDRAYRDVDSATDYAIQQGWADPNRLAIFGWSAGGFMTAWTVTQTHRYKAAIEGAGITDWGSFIWTSDVQQIDYDARWPGKEPQYFHQFSAVDFADRVTTPLLILHGGADRRVPTYQGQELFEALRANGKTVRMVIYPGSGHFPSLWDQQRDVFKEAIAWLKKYDP